MTSEIRNTQNAGWYRFKVGAFECTAIWDGYLLQTYQGIYPNAKPGELETLREDNLLHPDHIPMDLNVLVVNTRKNLLVVDAGMGETVKMFGEGMGRMRENLRAAGIDPADVDHVLMTHLHPDHAFGLIDNRAAAVFPKAVFCVTQPELDEWTAEAKLQLNDFRVDWVKGTIPAVAPYRDRLRVVEEGSRIVEGVSVTMAAGHSSGQCCYRFESQGQKLLVIGDTAHHPIYDLVHTDWYYSMDYDSNPSQGAEAKEKIFAEIADSGAFVLAYHFPFPGLGRIARRNGAYAFYPIPFNPLL
jgi:glyoxylase-like metal-dependent hydrolase (beta-lactamase superfamily II)